MTDTPRRVFGVLCMMVVVWIATYWLYEPGAVEPKVTFGETPPELVAPQIMRPAPTPTPVEPAAQPDPAPPQPQPRPEPPPPAMITRQRVEPPAFREYTVQRGDTSLEVVAQKQLGDRRLWRAIAEANPFLNPDKLIVGRTVLKIPLDPENIQGRVVEEQTPAPPAPPTPSPAPEPAKPVTPAEIEYTISSGDTLSGIAKQFYGDPGMWRVIYEANRGTLRDPDRLPRGAKIKIPPKPAGRG